MEPRLVKLSGSVLLRRAIAATNCPWANPLKVASSRSFTQLAYGYLPLILTENLAHYLQLGLTEAGQIWPVTLATIGLSGSTSLSWVADPAIITLLQGTTLLLGLLLTILLTQKIAEQRLGQL